PSTKTLDHAFNQAGDYMIRLKMNLSGGGYPVGSGMAIAAKAKKLVVTNASQPAPVVTNDAPGTVTQTSIAMKGHVDNEGDPAGSDSHFQMARKRSPTTVTKDPASPTTPAPAPPSTAVEATASSLTASTKYVYRVVAANTGGATKGEPDQKVETLAAAQP